MAISGLRLAGKIDEMDGSKFNNYLQLLNSFVDNFPRLEEKTRAALQARDYSALSKNLSSVHDLLEKIYADEMAQACDKHIDSIGSSEYDKLEAVINGFLSGLSVLSIDIQMAELREDPVKEDIEDAAVEKNTILAVDDTPFFLTVLKSTMQNTNYKLTCVASAIDALKFLERHRPALMLLDIEMAEMNGFKLAGKIRESGQKGHIIFLTGNAKKENVTKAVESGAIDFIVKPINKEGIIARIGKYMLNA